MIVTGDDLVAIDNVADGCRLTDRSSLTGPVAELAMAIVSPAKHPGSTGQAGMGLAHGQRQIALKARWRDNRYRFPALEVGATNHFGCMANPTDPARAQYGTK